MNSLPYIPKGLHSMNPYLFVSDPLQMIQFIQEAFDGKEVSRTTRSNNGHIANVMLLVGNATIMLSQASDDLITKGAGIYHYVSDVDVVHKRAIAAGATEMFAASDMPYGDRQSGIIDPSGNFWWISNRFMKEPYATNDHV